MRTFSWTIAFEYLTAIPFYVNLEGMQSKITGSVFQTDSLALPSQTTLGSFLPRRTRQHIYRGFFLSLGNCRRNWVFFFLLVLIFSEAYFHLTRLLTPSDLHRSYSASSSPSFAPEAYISRLKSQQVLRTLHSCAMVKIQTKNPAWALLAGVRLQIGCVANSSCLTKSNTQH